jgi:ABC-type nitrate/sulfonate/bicarbonate transport system substrate-binding protein
MPRCCRHSTSAYRRDHADLALHGRNDRPRKVRALAPVTSWIAPRFLFSASFARKEWAQQNRDVVKKFSDVLTASAAYTNAHHAELTATIADLESVSASAIDRMTWPTGGTSLNVREMQPVIDIAFRHGLIPKSFDAREMLFVR